MLHDLYSQKPVSFVFSPPKNLKTQSLYCGTQNVFSSVAKAHVEEVIPFYENAPLREGTSCDIKKNTIQNILNVK